MAGNNSNLGAAKRAKNDEFYTQLTDIEKELRHYRKHFRDATVLCNCDDPFESNFFKYFVLNFNRLGLKKLIATCYAGSAVAEYRNGNAKPYKAVVTTVHDTTGDGGVDMEDVRNLFELGENELVELEGDGDFRSEECLALLDEANIVVTNPPFSLFREYVAVLMEYQKKFVIVGNKNAITYKEIFPLLKDDVVWLGCESPCEFFTPEGMTKKVNGLTRWFTNLDIKKRHEELILVKKYAGHEAEYPTYDNYDAIEVSRVADIPLDFAGVMGVPITFLDKYNPDQFEIISMSRDAPGYTGMRKEFLDDYFAQGGTGSMKPGHPDLGYYMADGRAIVPYRRIVVRNKLVSVEDGVRTWLMFFDEQDTKPFVHIPVLRLQSQYEAFCGHAVDSDAFIGALKHADVNGLTVRIDDDSKMVSRVELVGGDAKTLI